MKRLLVIIYFFIFFQGLSPLLEARISTATQVAAVTSGVSGCATVALLYQSYNRYCCFKKQEKTVKGFVRYAKALLHDLSMISGFDTFSLTEQALLQQDQQLVRVAGFITFGSLVTTLALILKRCYLPSADDLSGLGKIGSFCGLYGRDYDAAKILFKKYKKPIKTVEDCKYNAALHIKSLDFIAAEHYKAYQALFNKELKHYNNSFVSKFLENNIESKADDMIEYLDGIKEAYFTNLPVIPTNVKGIDAAAEKLQGEKVILKPISSDDYKQVYELLTPRCGMQCGLHFPLEKDRKTKIKAQLDWEADCQKSFKALYYGIFDMKTGVLMGSIDVRKSDGEIGYWMGEAYRGEGRIEEAIKLITAEYFACTNVPYILAKVNPENIASLKSLLKTGFKIVGSINKDDGHRDLLQLDNPQVV